MSETKGQKIWRGRNSDACNPKFTRGIFKHHASLLVRETFSYCGEADRIILSIGQTITKNLYIHLLDNNLPERFAATGSEVLQQDGILAHTAKVIKHWLHTRGKICIRDRLSSSPDISPT